MRNHDAMLKMYKERQDETSQRRIYLQLLEDVRDGIVAGNIELLQSSCKSLLSLGAYEPPEKIRFFLEDPSTPFFGTNVIIFTCKYQQRAALEFFLNQDGVLLKLYEKVGLEFISPEMEDSSHHTAFYYAIRSNEVKTVELLMKNWPGSSANQNERKLYDLLSQSYSELKLKKVDLCWQMEKYIEGQLLAILYSPASQSADATVEITAEAINDRIDFLIEKIEAVLIEEQSSLDLFLFRLQGIARSIHFLKNAMKGTYIRIAWEEIEFCLVIYVASQSKKKSLTPVYRYTLPKQKLMNHLRGFVGCIQQERSLFVGPDVANNRIPDLKRQQVVDSVIAKYPELSSLYSDYERLRDLRSLEIVEHYIALALKADPDENEGKLVIVRMIQTLSQCMKNTLESPKMSEGMAKWLLSCVKEDIRTLILQFRNSSPCAVVQMVEIEVAANKSFLSDVIESTRNMMETIKGISFLKTAQTVQNMLKIMENSEDIDVIGEKLECFRMCKFDQPEHLLKEAYNYLMQIKQRTTEMLTDMSPRELVLLEEIELLCAEMIPEMPPVFNGYLRVNTVLSAPTTIEMLSKASEETFQRLRYLVGYTRKKLFEQAKVKFFSENQLQPKPLVVGIKLLELVDSVALRHSTNEYLEIFKKVSEILQMIEFTLDGESFEEIRKDLSKHNNSFPLGNEGYPIQIGDEVNNERLSRNMNDLKLIVSSIDANLLSRIKHDPSLEAALELIIMDVLSALNSCNCLPNNFPYVDARVPILVGERLLHHLEHNDEIVNILLRPTSSLILNAEQLMLKNLVNFHEQVGNSVHMGITSTEEIEEGTAKKMIGQQALFNALSDGSLDEVVACIESGADIAGRSTFDSTSAHYAAINSNKVILHYVLVNCQLVQLVNDDGETPLHFAAKHGRWENVKLLLTKISLDCMDNFGRTPLHLSAGQGSTQIIQLLLSQGADPKIIDGSGYSTIKWALYNSQEKACRVLVKKLCQQTHPADLFFTFSPLNEAAEMGSREIVEYILNQSGGECTIISDLISPLYLSVLRGRLEVVKILLDKNVGSVNGKYYEGLTPLQCATREGHEKKVELLLKYGADVDETDVNGKSLLYYVAKTGNTAIAKMILNKKPRFCRAQLILQYPLHWAVMFRSKEVLQLFLEYDKSSINTRDMNGVTPLHISAVCGDLESAKLLIKYGAKVSIKSPEGITALMCAAGLGFEDIVSILAENGASVNVTDNNGHTPLSVSARCGRHGVVKILLEKGATVDVEQHPPLHCASLSGDVQCVQLLLRNPCCVNLSDSDSNTALHLAAGLGHLQIVKCLLEAKAKVNQPNSRGCVALHMACAGGSVEVAKLLIKSGCNTKLPTSCGVSLLQVAVQSNSKDIVGLLLEMKSQVIPVDAILAAGFGFADILAMLLDHIPKHLLNECNLWEAACSGRKPICHNNISETLLKKGVGVNTKCSSKGIFAGELLRIALSNSDLRSLQILIDHGGNPYLLDKDGELPLHKAVRNGNLKAVMILLGKAPVGMMDHMHWSTLLASTIGNQQDQLLKLFLNPQYMLDIRTLCKNPKWPLLHIAAESGNVEIVKMLVDRGADIFYELNGNKAIHVAAMKGFPGVVEYFLSVNMNLYERGSGGNNLLHFVARGRVGHTKVAEMLVIEKNMDLNRTNTKGLTPLIVAYYFNNHVMISFFLNHGAIYKPHGFNCEQALLSCNTKALVDNIDKLFSAVDQGDIGQVELCVSKCVALNVRNAGNETPLQCASRKGHSQIVDIFLERGADPNLAGSSGCTALHYAVKHSHFQIVLSLLGRGAKFNIADKDNKTPLNHAKTPEIVTFLTLLKNTFMKVKARDVSVARLEWTMNLGQKKLRAFLNCRDSDGNTLLAAAILSECPGILQIKSSFLAKTPLKTVKKLLVIGRIEEAIDVYSTEAKQLHNALLAAVCLHSITMELWKNGCFVKALRYCTEIRQTYGELLGDDNKETLGVRSLLGDILGKTGQVKEALVELSEVFQKQKAFLNSLDPELLGTQVYLSVVLYQSGKLDPAVKMTSDLIEKLKIVHGSDHPVLSYAQELMASILFDLEEYSGALKMAEEILAKRTSLFGPTHPDTVRARMQILTMKNGLLRCMSRMQDDKKLINQLRLPQEMVAFLKRIDSAGSSCMPQLVNYAPSEVNPPSPPNWVLERLSEYPSTASGFMDFLRRPRTNANSSHSEGRGRRKKEETLSFKDVVKAISADEKSIVERMLKFGFDLNAKDNEGRTPLHYAVSRGKKDLVAKLIESGACVSSASNRGNTPFHLAANSGDNDLMKLLIQSLKDEEKAVLDWVTANKGMTALHVAASKRCNDIVETLLKNGARCDIINKDGKTPLDLLVSAPVHIETAQCVEEMNRLGTNISGSAHMAQSSKYGPSNANPASQSEFPYTAFDPMEYLLERMENKNNSSSEVQPEKRQEETLSFKDVVKAISADDKSIVKRMLKFGFDFNAKDNEGRTPLHYAVSRGKKDLVAKLIESGACVSSASNRGNTPFHLAANSGDNDLMKLLIQSLKDEEKAVLDWVTANKGMTALHVAASKRYNDIVETLLKNGARCDIINKDGKTPLDLLVSAPVHIETAQCVEEMNRLGTNISGSAHMAQSSKYGPSNANPASQSEFPYTAFDPMEYLLERMENKNNSSSEVQPEKRQEETLSFKDVVKAISADDKSIVERMLKFGFDFNAKDNEGRTPLHYAVSRGKKGLVAKLIESGACVSSASNKGNTPFHLAANSGDNDLMKLLIQSLKDEDKAVLDWVTANKGMTALHVAASKGYVSVVKTLLKNGARCDIVDKDSKMPVDLSVSAQVTSILIETARCAEEIDRLKEKLRKLGTYQ